MSRASLHRGAAALAALLLVPFGQAAAGHAKCTRSAEECAAAMKEMYQTKGWSGIESEERPDGFLQIVALIPESPADRAGIKAGDVILSMNGVTLTKANAPKIEEMKQNGLRIGNRVAYGVMRGKEVNTVKVELEKIPDAVLSGLIARHARDEHQVARN